MDWWDAEPFWEWWQDQLALLAQANAPAPDPQLTAVATEITRLLREKELRAHGQHLGALRHGKKHWNRRR